MDKRRKYIVLYSSSIATAIAAIAALLNFYAQNPEQVTINELAVVQNDLLVIAEDLQKESNMNQSSASAGINTVMAWWYPGSPACAAVSEASTYNLDVVKPEYFVVKDGGELELMTEALYGCNGYSKENVAQAKSLAAQQFVMVSASYAEDMNKFLLKDESSGEYTRELVNFVTGAGFTGIELDFEDFGGWTPENYARYKSFVTRLGNELHTEGKQLMVDVPAVRNNTEEAWYKLRLNEIEALPVDYIVVMGYDYQYDYGLGEPVAPLDWLSEVIQFTKQKIRNDSKIVIGIPSYGYIADRSTREIKIITETQAKAYAIYKNAQRDPASKELIATGGKMTLVYQDEVSIQAKIDTVAQNGLDKVSIWHLGGNPWFSEQ